MPVDDHRQVAEYFYQTIKPVVRTLMRFGFSARNAIDLIKWAYVRVFYETPALWRGQPSALQCSLKTGLSRTEIRSLEKISHPVDTQRAERRNRAAHVLFAWVNDPEFHIDGKPGWLPMCSRPLGQPSFRGLVSRYEMDARYQNVLADLIEVGCVKRERNGVRLVNPTYGSDAVDAEKLGVAGRMASRHGETVDHNVSRDNKDDRHLHRIWSQRKIPDYKISEVRRELARIGSKAGQEMDRYLASVASDVSVQQDSKFTEMGVVIFSYQFDEDNVNKQGSILKDEGDE